jgi:hypothetical protein
MPATDGVVAFPVATYRYVRVGLVIIVAGLLVSVVTSAQTAHCWQDSISAFYYTISHAVFIGTLCAAGICLLAYKGTTPSEDLLLNFSGFLAFIVAFVPTTSPALNPKVAQDTCGSWLPTNEISTSAVSNNLIATLIAVVIGYGLHRFFRRFAASRPAPCDAESRTGDTAGPELTGVQGFLVRAAERFLKWSQVILPWLVALVLVAGLLWFVIDRESFAANAHGYAAAAMFGGIILVVVLYASYAAQHLGEDEHRGWFAVAYIGFAAAMAVTLGIVSVLHVTLPMWNHWILAAELALILEFAGFWIVQTLDLWNGPYRPVVPPRPTMGRARAERTSPS